MIDKYKKSVFRRLTILFVALMPAIMPVASTFAIDENTLYDYAQNNILYYDGTEGNKSCYNGNLSGDTIMAKVVNYLSGNNPTNFVLSENGIAGILTNFQHESGFNPFRFQGDSLSGPAYGIAQFDPKSKILEPLRTDPRTAGYFDEYYNLKYTKFDSSTGLPTEGVPDDVVDAWLAVQMDYFFGSSSEFENTKVGSYRNKGGSMGLDYIDDSMTIHEAMDAAESPEDATRIFVWIAERPAAKERDANTRSAKAEGWLDYVRAISSAPASGDPDTRSTADGSDVTVIGDSITVGSEGALESSLPGVDIYAEVSKQFYTGTDDNPGGIEILQDLVDRDALRGTLIYALGTNSDAITSEQAEEVIDLAGPDRKVVFVTNYTTDNDYDSNNNVFIKMKNDNPENVFIADWKSAIQDDIDTYLAGDGIHPSVEGQELFASIIASTIGASNDYAGTCGGAVEGGLTDSQAQAIADYYNGPEVDASYWYLPHGKMNCVSFSAFFMQRFTSVGRSQRSWGNGKEVVHNLAQREGLPTGTEPRPFAVFSVTSGRTVCSDGFLCGHTGVVVAVNGNDVTTIEAAYRRSDAKVKHHDISYFVNTKYGDTFAYTDSILNSADIAEIAGE